jgi:hypothetical protein
VRSIVYESGVVKISKSRIPERKLAGLAASTAVLKKAIEQLVPGV